MGSSTKSNGKQNQFSMFLCAIKPNARSDKHFGRIGYYSVRNGGTILMLSSNERYPVILSTRYKLVSQKDEKFALMEHTCIL